MVKTYTVKPVLFEEIYNGHVWTNLEINSRLVKITNPINNKSVIAAHRKIDDNYLNIHKKRFPKTSLSDTLLIDEHYRKKLGINKNTTYDLNIAEGNNNYYQVKYLLQHANDNVRISSWLALWSMVLGVPGFLSLIYECMSKLGCIFCFLCPH